MLASLERIYRMLDEEEVSAEPAVPAVLNHVTGNVKFQNIRFGCTQDHILMQENNFSVKPGQKVTIVGSTGAGKITLINLLMRFYELNGGSILLDRINTTHMARADLQSNLEYQQTAEIYHPIYLFCNYYIIASVLCFGKFVLPVLVPFIIAFVIACILNKPINYISEKSGISRKIIAVFSVVIFMVLTGGLFMSLCSSILGGVKNIVSFSPELFSSYFTPLAEQVFQKLDSLFHVVDMSFWESSIGTILESVNRIVAEASTSILASITGLISRIPALFMKTVITIIATFFIATDFKNIMKSIKNQLPKTDHKSVSEIKAFFVTVLPKIILSYGLILAMTLTELLIGLSILKIPYAGILALLIAVVDILPILGTGMVLIPWAIMNLILGNYKLFIGLAVLYIVITVIRNCVEPKMVAKQVELHPVLVFASMLVGLRLFGVVGLIGFPLLLSLLKKLNDSGTIQLYHTEEGNS